MYIRYILLSLLSLLVFTACEKDEPVVHSSRTVLVYMAGNNSLSGFINDNIEKMVKGANGNLNGGNLLVYAAQKGSSPELYQIKQEGNAIQKITVRTYEGQNSATTETLKDVLNTVTSNFPADDYGLILWSHATAWIPSDYDNYLRSFGQDGTSYIEINDLASALSNYHFSFLAFDACYMSSVEVAYALRNCTDYFIGSPTEILATGFPYHNIIQPMFATQPDVVKIASEFYDYYNSGPEDNRYATISALKTANLDDLAAACQAIFKGKTDAELFAISTKELQLMEYLTRNYHALYDMDDYVKQLATPDQYTAFRQAMDKAIIYKAATPKSFYAAPYQAIAINKFSGLSIYVPQEALPKLNEWYKSLAWYKAVYQ